MLIRPGMESKNLWPLTVEQPWFWGELLFASPRNRSVSFTKNCADAVELRTMTGARDGVIK